MTEYLSNEENTSDLRKQKIAGRLTDQLKVNSISVIELSERTGVDSSTIYRILNAGVLPRATTIQRIAIYLRIHPSQLDEDGEYKNGEDYPSLKGGKQSKRDKEFPEFKDDEFRKWWHRIGKPKLNHGTDIETKREAEEWYERFKNDRAKNSDSSLN